MSTHGAHEADLDGKGLRLAVVTARFNEELTDAMHARALKETKALGARATVKARVPGTYDLPLAVDRALARDDVDAAVAIGVVVTGETGHDVLIAHATARSLTEIALRHGKPVGLGVTGPRQTYAQARARLDRAEWAVRSAVSQVRGLEGLKVHRRKRVSQKSQ